MGLFKRSADERDCCNLKTYIRVDGQPTTISCKIVNLSMDGAGLLFDGEVEDGPEHFLLSIPIIDELCHERPVELRWRMDRPAGVRFTASGEQSVAA